MGLKFFSFIQKTFLGLILGTAPLIFADPNSPTSSSQCDSSIRPNPEPPTIIKRFDRGFIRKRSMTFRIMPNGTVQVRERRSQNFDLDLPYFPSFSANPTAIKFHYHDLSGWLASHKTIVVLSVGNILYQIQWDLDNRPQIRFYFQSEVPGPIESVSMNDDSLAYVKMQNGTAIGKELLTRSFSKFDLRSIDVDTDDQKLIFFFRDGSEKGVPISELTKKYDWLTREDFEDFDVIDSRFIEFKDQEMLVPIDSILEKKE